MNADIFAALAQLEKERGIPQSYMIEKITQALVAAYKKDKDGYTDNVFVEVKDDDMHMYVQKEVVDAVITPATEITLDAALSPDAPLGVFGDCGAVVLRDGAAGRRIRARDLAGEAAHDITSLCRREGGKVALPGDVLARIGRERNPSGDCSSPGVVVSVAG